MLLAHPARPELAVRLAYGLNLFPAEDLAGVLAGLREVALPLRERVAGGEPAFGIGAWLPGRAALELVSDERRLAALLELLVDSGLDPFTFNAFPFGGFHRPGLKAGVFEPTWLEPERLRFTAAVARVAVRARLARGGSRPGQHLSVSTHAGQFAAARRAGDEERCARGLLEAALDLRRLEQETGERVVLSIEPEPRSSANDTRELGALFERLRRQARDSGREAEEALERHLAACLDACHAAVEFEAPDAAFERATAAGRGLGKLQFSSALALRAPDENREGRARFLALDEPVYLHQVTGSRGPERVRATDLGEVARRWEAGDWRGCDEWRCHFHLPVDLLGFGAGPGLATTQAESAACLRAALARPERWGSSELHVEVETYTWSLLRSEGPGASGRPAVVERDPVEGPAREWRHVAALLAEAGWHPRAPRAAEARARVDSPGRPQ